MSSASTSPASRLPIGVDVDEPLASVRPLDPAADDDDDSMRTPWRRRALTQGAEVAGHSLRPWPRVPRHARVTMRRAIDRRQSREENPARSNLPTKQRLE